MIHSTSVLGFRSIGLERNHSPEMSEAQTPTPTRLQGPMTPSPISAASPTAANSNDGLHYSPTNKPMRDFSLFGSPEQDPMDGLMIGSPPMFPSLDGGLGKTPSPSISLFDHPVERKETTCTYEQALTDPESHLRTSDMFGTAILENHGMWGQSVDTRRPSC
jgi:hypothetical protein